ncbi:phosphatase [Thermogemmatispora aurantia]|uniref:Phosphatase n=1 Tax=Thermogemmatispora aurantia TaxID=2045279 RepID=A0A5J4K7Z6_9CHLR|nr:PHP domain-containing protein [Thermogemmatispora aurantia]GER82777.1 phosphatase [Thermogemmatispora aurantia]
MDLLTTAPLKLSPEAPIDLHMHTTYSDGRWTAEQLIAYLVQEGFALVAVTDHDRVDTINTVRQLAASRGLPVLAGVEMSTTWRNHPTHVLCYGFDPETTLLREVIADVKRRQHEHTREVYETLKRRGYSFPRAAELLAASGGEPQQLRDNVLLLIEHGYAPDWPRAMEILREAGQHSIHAEMAATVEAVHRSGGVALIAHPGRRERGFTFYDTALLEEVRAEVPLDGLEVYHPYHSPETIESYLAYVNEHDLLLSTGSDSHGHAGRMPIKYRAEISQRLLERLGVQVG